MIKVENIKVVGLARSIYSARNAMNSWDRSDSDQENDIIGPNDLKLMRSLFKGGTEHRKYARMINVYMDITAPLYWFKEADTYKVGTVCNSCSTMHKIHAKEFTLDDFSHEHIGEGMATNVFMESLENTIDVLNEARLCYLDCKDKNWWWQMIQLLPSSYNQKRTIMMNYETVFNIIRQRKNHKLDEWNEFVEILQNLPYVREIME